jgi:hypothetical protein
MFLLTFLSTIWEAHYIAIVIFFVLATVFAIYTHCARQPLSHAQTTRIYRRMLGAHGFELDPQAIHMIVSAYQTPARVLALTSKDNLAFLYLRRCLESSKPRPASEPYMLLAKRDTGYRLVLGLWQDVLMEGEADPSIEDVVTGFADPWLR